MTPEYVAVSTIAARLSLSRHAVYAAIRRGDLAAVRGGTRNGIRVRSADVEAWLRASAVVPSEPPPLRAVPPRSPGWTDEDEEAANYFYGKRRRRAYRQDTRADRRVAQKKAPAVLSG